MSENACEVCTISSIPARLHRNGRPVISEFDEDELLYRRFKVEGSKEDWETNQDSRVKIFAMDNDSYNRSKFSECPEDVLYNKDSEEHHLAYGIVSIKVSDVLSIREAEVNNERRIFTAVVNHKPENCMYPHCDLVIYSNGQVAEKRPKSVKAVFRNLLVGFLKIEKPFVKGQESNG
ncbi:hypothetical protein [Siphonobacter curvatus]|uniref:Uncharacterized protein n=1 Tax=Siphonobacter curvatus TaxID=2094562 RepID=A0A2S7IR59_9BACT|nr:hypothetical protein [Siphonobacter curvatus]PQA60172.1 hypothetical protein C5O19_11295 [Siphonobacter curvatus]